MKRIVNLTPHNINIWDEGGLNELQTVEPSGVIARCAITQEIVGRIYAVSLFRVSYGEVEDLPEEKENTIFIVSLLVRLGSPERQDLASPGELIRDNEGKPVGCKGLVIN